MLARSLSVMFENAGHGIGGRIGRPLPMCFPVRIACMNCSCDHAPSPAAESGVRFAEKLTPHGPEKAVNDTSIAPIHGGGMGFGPGTRMLAGCPESNFVVSCIGPCGPIAHGVWQSPQPVVFTRYL